MGRRVGSKDLKKRKRRKDRKHKYVQRHGSFVPYTPKRQRGDPIKIWFWQRLRMSQGGRMRWTKKARPHIVPKVTHFHVRVDVDPSKISNVENIKKFVLEVIGHEGEFLMMGFSRGRNKFRVKPVKLCRIYIMESSVGLKVFVKETHRLSRYWFYQK